MWGPHGPPHGTSVAHGGVFYSTSRHRWFFLDVVSLSHTPYQQCRVSVRVNMQHAYPKVEGGGSLLLAWQVKDKNVLVVGGGEVCRAVLTHSQEHL